jgi:hypothetical protein
MDSGETSARARVAKALRRHVDGHFNGNVKRAAEDLGYERQRLHSYLSKASFPGADVFDTIKQKWALDLLNVDSSDEGQLGARTSEDGRQLSLFDPIRLVNDGVTIVLERKGAAVEVGIAISPLMRLA